MIDALSRRLLWVLPLALLLCATSCSSSKKSRKKKTTKVERRAQQESGSMDAFVRDWEGVPYKYGGTSKSGVDCSGFVGVLYRDVYKKDVPRTTEGLARSSKSLDRNELVEGDLVFFDIQGKKKSHVGVYLRNEQFVHASSSKGVVVSSLTNPYYQKAFSSGGRP
ncbi:MAG: NlpC/P60 family protein [Cryomorphaceae bacterium]